MYLTKFHYFDPFVNIFRIFQDIILTLNLDLWPFLDHFSNVFTNLKKIPIKHF